MPFIEWIASYDTGIKEVDEQHRNLAAMINKLHDAIIEKQAKKVIGPVLEDLVKYTQVHFRTEEKILLENNSSFYQRQKAEHDALTARASEMIASHWSGEGLMNTEVLLFLKNWLSHHILEEDLAFADELKQKGVV